MTEDYIYEFKAPNGVPSKCRIRTFIANDELHKGDLVIVASQLVEGAGMSVTNAAEVIATGVRDKHQVPVHRLIWIEHYPSEARGGPSKRPDPLTEETFDRVTFNLQREREGWSLCSARWNRISRQTLEALIGEPF